MSQDLDRNTIQDIEGFGTEYLFKYKMLLVRYGIIYVPTTSLLSDISMIYNSKYTILWTSDHPSPEHMSIVQEYRWVL
jgi:hypothetical protein